MKKLLYISSRYQSLPAGIIGSGANYGGAVFVRCLQGPTRKPRRVSLAGHDGCEANNDVAWRAAA